MQINIPEKQIKLMLCIDFVKIKTVPLTRTPRVRTVVFVLVTTVSVIK